MRRLVFLGSLLMFTGTGCDISIADLTNPTLAQATVLDVFADGADLPDEANAYLGTWVTVHVVDGDATVSGGEPVPIEGTRVYVEDGDGLVVEATSGEDPGSFEIGPDAGLRYGPWEIWTIIIQEPDEDYAGTMQVILPSAPEADVPGFHAQGQPVVLDLHGQGFNYAVSAVLDIQAGELTHWDAPSGYDETREALHDDNEAGYIELPGRAFPQAGSYVVGVAGMIAVEPGAIHNVNATLSGAAAGRMQLMAMQVADNGLGG